jgi:hypothetical protein
MLFCFYIYLFSYYWIWRQIDVFLVPTVLSEHSFPLFPFLQLKLLDYTIDLSCLLVCSTYNWSHSQCILSLTYCHFIMTFYFRNFNAHVGCSTFSLNSSSPCSLRSCSSSYFSHWFFWSYLDLVIFNKCKPFSICFLHQFLGYHLLSF